MINFLKNKIPLLILFILVLLLLKPILGEAYIIDSFKNLFFEELEVGSSSVVNLDNYLLKPNIMNLSKHGDSDSLADDTENPFFSKDEVTALTVISGPIRVSTEEEKIYNDTISVYEVHQDDTLDSVAKLFNISKNTIIWANDLKSSKLQTGQVLIIFPITGIQYLVKGSESIKDIAKKYKADTYEIFAFNNISESLKLKKGDIIFIPNVEEYYQINSDSKNVSKPKYANNILVGYFMKPVSGCVKTQERHGYNGVDLGCKIGTLVIASASGKVIIAKGSGYNGGYGRMVAISHSNKTQTVYAHLSKLNVEVGDNVIQGQIIGSTGNTGRSTGPHIHFEVRGSKNPF